MERGGIWIEEWDEEIIILIKKKGEKNKMEEIIKG